MELSTWLRGQLWKAPDWGVQLAELNAEVAQVADAAERSERLWELGRTCEQLLPDPEWALAFYQQSWRLGQHPQALGRARVLYRVLGRFDMVARLAEVGFRATSETQLLVLAGLAWLDGGWPDRALAALNAASADRPDDAAVRALRAIAQMSPNETEREIGRLQDEARRADDGTAAQLLLQAARILRRLQPEGLAFEEMLRLALARDLRDPAANALLELSLAARKQWNELIRLVERRASVADSDGERVEIFRRCALQLAFRFNERTQAVQLLERALTFAYGRSVNDVFAHLAMLTWLRDELVPAGKAPQVVELCDRALATPLSDDERLYIAMLAASVGRGLGDRTRLGRHVAIVKQLKADHPLVIAFEAQAEAGRRAAANAPQALTAAPPASVRPALSKDSAAERQVQREALVRAQREALEKSRREQAEAKAQREAEAKARREAQERAQKEQAEAEAKARREAQERAQAEAKARREAEAKARREAQERAQKEQAEEKTRREAEEKARREAEEKTRRQAEAKTRREAEEKTRRQAEERRAEERRAAERLDLEQAASVDISGHVEVKLEDGPGSEARFSGISRDISRVGVFVKTDRQLTVGASVAIKLAIPGEAAWSLSEYEMKARIVRVEPNVGFGAVFLQPSSEYQRDVDALVKK